MANVWNFCTILFILTLFAGISVAKVRSSKRPKRGMPSPRKKCMLTFDLSICYTTGPPSNVTAPKSIDCQSSDICQKLFKITYVKLEPYTTDIVVDLLRTCCGSCVNASEINIITKSSDIPSPATSSAHLMFPVLGRSNYQQLYGYHFIPLVKTPSLYYITARHNNQLQQLIISCINMWPLIVICVLLVAISGFVGWLLETGENKDQFPSDFLMGWFEGFWWSFISMTTVGYGDKVPKSIMARLFTIVWIFIGITTFSLVTAMLSSEISDANRPPTPTMRGRRVGAIRNRLYDAIIIEKQGGILVDINPYNVTQGIHELVRQLNDEKINGFVLDRYTLLLFKRVFKDSYAHRHEINFLETKSIHTEVSYKNEEYSYGVLVKEKEDYDYLRDFVMDNRDVINTCNGLLINNLSTEMKTSDVKNPLFSTSGRIFWTAFACIGSVIGFILCFGLVYEIKRRSKLCHRRCTLI